MIKNTKDKQKKSGFLKVVIIVLSLAILGLILFQVFKEKEIGNTEIKQEVPKDIPEKVDPIKTEATQILREMTLDEKIGQLIVVGFPSKVVDAHMQKMIKDYKVGGVILYDRNMETPKQVANLTNDLQALALKNKYELPLIMSVDQEGGDIVRMRDKVSNIPSQQKLSQTKSEADVYQLANRNGAELKAMGINVNYAPVLDLSNTDSRSFGIEPNKTGAFGEEVVKGLTDAGVTATLKHFPGHGKSDVDPHIETSSVEATLEELEKNELSPFKKMIEDVNHNKFFVMVTHIKYPAYDKEMPASLSRKIITDLLRDQLGYTGLVVTDDLEMGAVSKYYTYEDIGYHAVEAGSDLLLVCHTEASQIAVINGIKAAVQAGKITEATIDEAVNRILLYKLTTITSTKVDANEAEALVGKN